MGVSEARRSSLRALVLTHGYSMGMTLIADETLGEVTSNAGVQLMLALARQPGITASELAAQLGLSRPGLSHVLAPLLAQRLVERRPSHRQVGAYALRLTSAGETRLGLFERGLADYYRSEASTVKAVLLELDHPALDESPGPPVSALACMSAMADAGTPYVAQVSRALAGYGLASTRDRYTLCLLSEQPDLRPVQLAGILGLSRSGATDLVSRLESAGLVTRSRPAMPDGRAVTVALSPRGRSATTALIRVWRRHATEIADALALTLRVESPARAD